MSVSQAEDVVGRTQRPCGEAILVSFPTLADRLA
jgi:hypothetical protein